LQLTFPPTRTHSLAHLSLTVALSLSAGAGTLLEVAELRARHFAVVNPALMDNHQTELAAAFNELSYVVGCCSIQCTFSLFPLHLHSSFVLCVCDP
jgi:UDP-N-acetylglucosamine transferase subunit ALG13